VKRSSEVGLDPRGAALSQGAHNGLFAEWLALEEKLLLRWIENPPETQLIPAIRRNFLTMAQAEKILAGHSDWAAEYKGDLQMHSTWSDGSGSIADMAEAAAALGYEYISIWWSARFILRCVKQKIKPSGTLRLCGIRMFKYSGIRAAEFTIIDSGYKRTGLGFSRRRPNWIKRWKSILTSTGRI